MKRCASIIGIVVGLFLLVGNGFSAEVFVSDTLSIDLYDEPTKESKVIGTLLSGEAVDVIVSDEAWSFVRPLEQENEDLRGFIETKYLMDRLPWKKKALPIRDENERISEKLRFLDKELKRTLLDYQALTKKLGATQDELRRIQKEYESLKINAGDYIRLKEAYASALAGLRDIRKARKALLDENERLLSSQSKRFFVAEGLLLIFGLVIGLAIGRLEKKTKSLLYY
ncbi:MAG: TIGR04211 family SH3 domain-containing protein [Deltaproteobacteria bacterium]|nr:TIGR04211 family SH3 domain-containing protein [Deltaproteobacteria bacterium]MBW2137991.1 TIGR04211 family SH3 domain-containing protein [Deltaproteobacteria bacterium]